MPRKARKIKSNRKTKTVRSRHEMIDTKTENIFPQKPNPMDILSDKRAVSSFRWGVVVVLLFCTVIIWLVTRGYIVAALVDGKPIFGWNVGKVVMSRYGSQTLDSMISEQLVIDAARKANIRISNSQVTAKVDNLVKSLGANVKLADLLKYQGLTQNDFESQVRLQLTVEALLGKDILISDKDIDDYIEKNKEILTATDEAGLREEARKTLFSQKMSEKIQPWFTELKSKAHISRLLK